MTETEQLDIFDLSRQSEAKAETGRARNTDPETSKESAKKVNATSRELIVLKALATCPVGATCQELVDLTGLAWNTLSPRLAPLREKGLIRVRLDSEGNKLKRGSRLSTHRQLVWENVP